MKTLIKFRLSEAGRKAALLAGRCADEYQAVEVTPGTPEFAEVVAAGKIGSDTVTLDCGQPIYHGFGDPRVEATAWNHVPTVRELPDDQTRRTAALAAAVAAKEDAARQDALSVFAERRTVTRTGSYGYGATNAGYEERLAAWAPTDAEAVRLVPEAAAWVAELTVANEAAKKAAEQRHLELKAETEAAAAKAKEEAAQAESERRASLGLEDGEFDYAVENGAIMRVPCYDTGRRSKNWMATITVDPSKPGGLDRDFCEKAHGDAYYILPTLNPGDAIEFGADSYSSRGRKSPERAYRVVVRVEVQDGNGYIVLRKCGTGKEACREGAKLAKQEAAVA